MRKKLLSLALALVMCLGLTVPAMAAELQSDKCTYELSNDPIGTTECNDSTWDKEKGDWVDAVHTVYIIPDNTVVTCKTAPDGKIVAGMRADGLFLDEYLEWGSEFWNGEAFTIPPLHRYTTEEFTTQEAIIYRLFAEGLNEYGDLDSIDSGIYIMSATSAAKAGITAGAVPSTAETPATPTTPAAPKFTDVAAGSPFAAAIDWAVAQGITNGKTETTFGPGDTCTVSHILTFLWRANGRPDLIEGGAPEGTADRDLAAYWAIKKGMINQGDNVDVPCTRSAAVTYMWKAAGSPEADASKLAFTDVTGDAAVAWAVEKGVTKGTSDTAFSPDATCTRGQIVTFLYRAANAAK